jgi:hypothetical protein
VDGADIELHRSNRRGLGDRVLRLRRVNRGNPGRQRRRIGHCYCRPVLNGFACEAGGQIVVDHVFRHDEGAILRQLDGIDVAIGIFDETFRRQVDEVIGENLVVGIREDHRILLVMADCVQ